MLAMPFRKPQDPEALERWKQVQRALKAKRNTASEADPRLQAMMKTAKERQRAALEKARERIGAARAEAKKGQRAAFKEAKERVRALAAARNQQRESAAKAERGATLLRRFVRPASGPTVDVVAALVRKQRRPAPPAVDQHGGAPASEAACGRSQPRPEQLAFLNLKAKDE